MYVSKAISSSLISASFFTELAMLKVTTLQPVYLSSEKLIDLHYFTFSSFLLFDHALL